MSFCSKCASIIYFVDSRFRVRRLCYLSPVHLKAISWGITECFHVLQIEIRSQIEVEPIVVETLASVFLDEIRV